MLFPSEFANQPTTHEGYNRFVQTVQSEAHSWGFETRTVMRGDRAHFEIFWDMWHLLGSEVPFTKTDDERRALINPDLWLEIQSSAAMALHQ